MNKQNVLEKITDVREHSANPWLYIEKRWEHSDRGIVGAYWIGYSLNGFESSPFYQVEANSGSPEPGF